MKTLLTIPLLIMLVTPAIAAGDSPWLSDFASAKRQAKESGKPIFAVIRCER